jgi:nicotinamide-nucleotide amidase
VSEPVARAMAEGALREAHAHIAVASTGVAGPGGGTPMKPVGLVHLAAARENRALAHVVCRFGDIGRNGIRLAAVETALTLIRQMMT